MYQAMLFLVLICTKQIEVMHGERWSLLARRHVSIYETAQRISITFCVLYLYYKQMVEPNFGSYRPNATPTIFKVKNIHENS
jgi:hypothetical protein